MNTWVWVNYQGSATNDVMKFTAQSTGLKTVLLFGNSDGMLVDKMIFLGSGETCSTNGSIPSGDGSNCSSSASVVDPGISASDANQTIPTILAENPNDVEKVEYFVNGELIQSSNSAKGFDNSLLENGTYELTTCVTYADGTVVEDVEQIDISNPAELFGGVKRWIRRNTAVTIVIVSALTALGAAAAIFFGVKMHTHKKLYLIHHGLAK